MKQTTLAAPLHSPRASPTYPPSGKAPSEAASSILHSPARIGAEDRPRVPGLGAYTLSVGAPAFLTFLVCAYGLAPGKHDAPGCAAHHAVEHRQH